MPPRKAAFLLFSYFLSRVRQIRKSRVAVSTAVYNVDLTRLFVQKYIEVVIDQFHLFESFFHADLLEIEGLGSD